MLLQDNVLSIQERLVGLYLLFTATGVELADNPFLVLFQELLTTSSTTAAEHNFLVELFSGKQVTGQSVESVVTTLKNVSVKAPVPQHAVQLMMAASRESGPLASPWKRTALGRVVFHPETRDDRAKRELVDEVPPRPLPYPRNGNVEDVPSESTKLLRARHSVPSGFEPRWIRPVPPRFESVDEVVWMDVDVMVFDLLWDAGLGAEDAPWDDLRRLLNEACNEPLTEPQQKTLLDRLEKLFVVKGDAATAAVEETTATVTPTKLPALVENNPGVAFEVLLKLMSRSSLIPEYLSVLVSMDMTLHSMEVVNRLTMAVELPTEFVHLYATNCISSCRKVEDKFTQTRLVRFVCVFLQSLIRNKIVDVGDLFVEVQAFCLEFIKIREASGLFRMLKTGAATTPDEDAE